jgi:hypothetical protein
LRIRLSNQTHPLPFEHVTDVTQIGQIDFLLLQHVLQEGQPVTDLENRFVQAGKKRGRLPAWQRSSESRNDDRFRCSDWSSVVTSVSVRLHFKMEISNYVFVLIKLTITFF